MTTRRIEELAKEVAQEMGQNLSGFRVDRADVAFSKLYVTFSWTHPVLTTVHVQISDEDTEATVKAAIRDQLSQE